MDQPGSQICVPVTFFEDRNKSSVVINRDVGHAQCEMLIPLEQMELLQFGTKAKHTRGEEINGKNLKIIILAFFHLERRENVKNKIKSPVNVRFSA